MSVINPPVVPNSKAHSTFLPISFPPLPSPNACAPTSNEVMSGAKDSAAFSQVHEEVIGRVSSM
jgi:hypothetical protein